MIRLLAVLLLPSASAFALAAGDPFDGKWKLDLEHSQVATDNRPIDMSISIRTLGESVQYDSETTYDSGRTLQMHYTAKYDGSLALVTGSVGLMTPVSLKRIDDNTVEASYIRGFQVLATSRRVVSANRRLMTITTTSIQPGGKSTSSVSVFVKISEGG